MLSCGMHWNDPILWRKWRTLLLTCLKTIFPALRSIGSHLIVPWKTRGTIFPLARSARRVRSPNIADLIQQRSLVSLARALVKDTKILILDEATGSGTEYYLSFKSNNLYIQLPLTTKQIERFKIRSHPNSLIERYSALLVCFPRPHFPMSAIDATPPDRLRTIISYDRVVSSLPRFKCTSLTDYPHSSFLMQVRLQ